MKPIIFNSTPLIYLAKVGLSNVIEGLKGEKFTSPTVKFEVIEQGKTKGVSDAIILEDLLHRKILKVVPPKNQTYLNAFLKTKGLHSADAEVLTLAKEYDGIAIIDDGIARKTAKIYSISHMGTASLLIKCVYQKLISKERVKQAINEMIRIGWRCSIETYTRIMDVLEKIKIA